MRMMIVREYIELYQSIYNLDENTYDKIKAKVYRELRKLNSWYELDEKQSIGKTTAYVLDEETENKLNKVMRPYFQKLANIQSTAFEKQKKANKVFAENLNDLFVSDNRSDEERYTYEIPKEDKLYVMIEALFNEQFSLNEELWKEDYTNCQLFFDDEEAMESDSLIISTFRLKNPFKYYVKKKESNND